MEVILLERVAKLGHMGDTVRVKDGFARNFLLPRGKALRATEANKKKFESQRAELEVRNSELKADAAAKSAKLDGQTYVIIRQAGETGQLYGSVSARDIADTISAAVGFTVHRNHVSLLHPIKNLGLHKTPVHLHPEVEAHCDHQRRPLARAGRAPGQGRRPYGARADLDGRSRPRSRRRARRSRPRREPRARVNGSFRVGAVIRADFPGVRSRRCLRPRRHCLGVGFLRRFCVEPAKFVRRMAEPGPRGAREAAGFGKAEHERDLHQRQLRFGQQVPGHAVLHAGDQIAEIHRIFVETSLKRPSGDAQI